MKSDIRYIIKRIIVGVAIALILMLIKSNVFAQSITVSVNQTYLYDQTGNSATNITSSNSNITTAGITYIRSNKTKTRLRYNFNPFSSLTNGYYDIIFNTFNQDENIPVATISFGSNTFNCESISDYYTSFYSNGSVNDVEFQSGGNVLYICRNVYVTNTNYANLYFTSGVNGSSTHYFYLSSVFNFILVENISSAIQEQTEQQHQDSQDTQNAINDVNNSITSDTTPSGSDTNSAYSNFDNSTAQNGVITSLITLPIQLFTNINNSVNQSCTRFDMGTLLGTRIYFNCINPSNYIGSQLWGVIDILMSGFLVWHIAKKFIKVFENLSSLKEGDPVGD